MNYGFSVQAQKASCWLNSNEALKYHRTNNYGSMWKSVYLAIHQSKISSYIWKVVMFVFDTSSFVSKLRHKFPLHCKKASNSTVVMG